MVTNAERIKNLESAVRMLRVDKRALAEKAEIMRADVRIISNRMASLEEDSRRANNNHEWLRANIPNLINVQLGETQEQLRELLARYDALQSSVNEKWGSTITFQDSGRTTIIEQSPQRLGWFDAIMAALFSPIGFILIIAVAMAMVIIIISAKIG